MISNNSTYSKFRKDLEDTLNLLGLSKAIPIFQYGFPIVENNEIIVRFPEGCKYDCKLVLNSGQEINLKESMHWFVFQNMVVKSKMGTIISDTIETMAIDNAPFYIKIFNEVVKKYYKKYYLFIHDRLPTSLTLIVHGSFNLLIRKATFEELINRMGLSKKITQDVLEKIDFKKMTFGQMLEVVLEDKEKVIGHSYCIACGKKIENKQIFCIQGRHLDNKKKYYCLNKFNYWLESRCGITNTKDKKKEREKYHKELQKILKKHPFSAHDIFREQNKKLFEPKYKDRWKK